MAKSKELVPCSDEVRTAHSPRREIDGRNDHGIEVIIWWIKKSNLVLMSLTELSRNQTLEFAIEPDEVSDALQHPYIYAYNAGMEFKAEEKPME